MILFQNCARQSRSPTKMAATVQLRCYWKQLWSRWAITGSWESLVHRLTQMSWPNLTVINLSSTSFVLQNHIIRTLNVYYTVFRLAVISSMAREQEEFEDTIWVIRIRKSKYKQHNGQKKKNKRTNKNLQNTTKKTKDTVKRAPLKTGTRRVTLVTNPVVSHDKNRDTSCYSRYKPGGKSWQKPGHVVLF
jgi:hypothetical protein